MRRTRRVLGYLRAMFPPATMVPSGIVQFLSLYVALQALAGAIPLRLGWRAAVGAVSTVLWMLLVRLQDDITDADADVRLARAGDPRYRDRPIARGEITVPELRGMYHGGTLALVGLNLSFGFSAMLAACVAGLALTWLGFRWFFIPALARDPSPLAYLVRKSLTVLVGLYVLAAFHDEFRPTALSAWAIPLLVVPVAGVAAWETARKIRVPADETEYATYSKVLGWRRAAWLPALFVGVAAACLAPVARVAGLGAGFLLPLAGATGLAVAACLRFRLRPSPASANLRPYVEVFGVISHGGMAAALMARHGVVVA